MAAPPSRQYQPDRERRSAILSLRWILIILASYLILFSHVGRPNFLAILGFSLCFAATNLLGSLVPLKTFEGAGFRGAMNAVDVVLVTGTLFLLRVPGNYLYAAFLLVFLLAEFWRELKIVLFSLFAVSVLYGLFASLRFLQVNLGVDVAIPFGSNRDLEQFLTLALFFVVSIFYLFLSDRIDKDAQMALAVIAETRRAEMMAEVTRSISASLNSQEILHFIVNRLCEVLGASECSIVGIDPQLRTAHLMFKSGEDTPSNLAVDVGQFPELLRAYDTRSLQTLTDVFREGVNQSIIVCPMFVRDSVLGLIQIRFDGIKHELVEADELFFKVVAGVAANALRNAQLFEEMEHRARTDFLTGLPNHRFFQSTLAKELIRAQRHNHSLSLLLIDLDFLKEVNDRFGHPSGDMVIRAVAETIRAACREIDLAARYGGEEFTVILPETPLTGAIQVAERIRERIGAVIFPGIGHITASIGVANFPVNALVKEDLIRVADQALYVAKNDGRNRVSYFNYQLITR